MWKEFKEFAFRGNVLDMAVGVMIGGAFGKIVTSLVNDLFMPLFGLFGNRADLSELFLVLGGDGTQYATLEAAKAAGAAVLAYGSFLAAVVDFLLIALCIFFMLKLVSKLRFHKKQQEELQQPAAPRLCPYCRMEVAADATRCPHCTSVLEEPDAGVKD